MNVILIKRSNYESKGKKIQENIEKAIKALADAYESKFSFEWTIEELNSRTTTEVEAIHDFDLKPSELRIMEERGLQIFEEGGKRFYNTMELEGYYDLCFCTEPEE